MAVTVIGLGNVLIGDDALGPHVVRTLEAEYVLPPEVTVHDLGTPGLDLAPYLMEMEAVVVVDTVKAEGEPGEIRRYTWADILKQPDAPRLTPHEPGLKETVLTLQMLGCAPGEVEVIGVIPGAVETGIGLTDEVAAAVPRAVEEVVRLLEGLGYPPARRNDPGVPDLWWVARPQRAG